MMIQTITLLLMTMAMMASGPMWSQQYSGNIFEESGDIGNCGIMGSAEFNPERQEYILTGSGENIWFNSDQFHFAWKKLKGDFILTADVRFTGEGSHEHRKAGWMIRDGLEGNAPHVSAAVHGDGLASLQYRVDSGGETAEHRSSVNAPDVIQLERRGDIFIFSAAVRGLPFDTVSVSQASMTGEIYAGLFVCSHDNSVAETAVFSNVRITQPAGPGLVPYRDYLGSRLETMDVETGHRTVVFQAQNSIQAPNWTPDGRYLIYNSEGLLYRFDLETGRPAVINSGFATSNNNDHVLSFDGRMLGISHHAAEEDNRSIIYIMPAEGVAAEGVRAEGVAVERSIHEGRFPEGGFPEGGFPERITAKGPSYLHGWSPDGCWLTYTAERNGNYDIYKIQVREKQEIRLTDSPGLDDGSEYSPDGKYIYFNSVRTGTMKLWRMMPDGSQPEQLTFDEYNDWFPHISPDGRQIVFLSFMPEVKADDHPFYKHVYIRRITIPEEQDGRQDFTALKPEVIAYLYGGQGTINVPSWSPDGKKVAFVSNSGELEQ